MQYFGNCLCLPEMKYLIVALGWTLSKTPDFVVRGLCAFVVAFMRVFMNSRMRIGYSNLSHCFPEMSDAEIKAVGDESARRMVEMALFVLANPYMKMETLRQRFSVDDYLVSEFEKNSKNPSPIVVLSPHFCMMEAITLMPVLVDSPVPRIGVFYRPFADKSIESWVKESRQRCGLTLLSRNDGSKIALDFLRANGCIAVMFDQNMGRSGTYGLLFDRICSSTKLPQILVQHSRAKVAVIYAKRTGLWRARIFAEWLDVSDPEDIAPKMNAWLQNKLSSDAEIRKDWLWVHHRWPKGMAFGLSAEMKKSQIENCVREAGGELRRVNRIAITPPASLRGTFALVPLLRALRKSRPDASVSVVCERRFYEVLSAFDFADEILCAPNCSEKLARLSFFATLRRRYFDTHAVIEDTFLADAESRILDAIENIALQSTARKRRFFKKVFSADYASEAEGLSQYYERFFRAFGLSAEADFSPLKKLPSPEGKTNIAIVCGGRGNHALSAQKWGEIIKSLDKKLDDAKFVVLGDDIDTQTAFEITRTAEYADIRSLAGRLTDSELMEKFADINVVVGTDCRLTHIANALGKPVVAVYGQTNPVRNGLVSDAPKAVVRPRNSPPQGGVPVEDIDVSDVVSEVLILMKE